MHWMLGLVTGVRPQDRVQRVRNCLVSDLAAVRCAAGITKATSGIARSCRPDVTGEFAVVPCSEGQFSNTILIREYAHHFMMQYLDVLVTEVLTVENCARTCADQLSRPSRASSAALRSTP